MSEAMATERIVALYAQLTGYLTEVRVPVLGRKKTDGGKKTGTQLGDLDVVGLSARGELLVAECKAYGGPESYENWLKPGRLRELNFLAWSSFQNIAEVRHPRWGPEFDARKNVPDELWLVFSGRFVALQSPASWQIKDDWHKNLLSGARSSIASMWDRRRDLSQRALETACLEAVSHVFSEEWKRRVKLMPVHRLIEALVQAVAADMKVRRKRYADTSLEMIRMLVRSVEAGALTSEDLAGALEGRGATGSSD